MKRILLPLLLAACCPAVPAAALEAAPAPAAREDTAAVRDKLAASLSARGDLADRIIDSGLAHRFVGTQGLETHAALRSALLEWIRLNPDKAAAASLGMKEAGGKLHDSIETREMSWRFNPAFLEAIRALNAAAGGSAVSKEEMELAARRLYGAEPPADEAPAVVFGGGAGRAADAARIDYADYRLDKAGLDRELARAGAWLEAVRQGGGGDPAGAGAAAFGSYQEFLVAASEVKGRAAMTQREARRLETLRARLRGRLAALALRRRSAALRSALLSLRSARSGAAAPLLAALEAGAATLDGLAADAAEAGLARAGELAEAGENAFAEIYLRYTVYEALRALLGRAGPAGFSCFNDYVVYRGLAALFPGAAYPRARAALAAAAGPLENALALAAAGDLAGAVSGVDAASLERDAAIVEAFSARNRAVQFFGWGLVFRPLELELAATAGRPSFRPVAGIVGAAGKGRVPAALGAVPGRSRKAGGN